MVNGLHLTGTFLDNWKAFTHDTHQAAVLVDTLGWFPLTTGPGIKPGTI